MTWNQGVNEETEKKAVDKEGDAVMVVWKVELSLLNFWPSWYDGNVDVDGNDVDDFISQDNMILFWYYEFDFNVIMKYWKYQENYTSAEVGP